ncbi:uncharacterized protein TNCV_4437921 [Trichonephila clavipes]|nr:uncharacterized protein TNCV_4437921 [Trichonephila clavipes]
MKSSEIRSRSIPSGGSKVAQCVPKFDFQIMESIPRDRNSIQMTNYRISRGSHKPRVLLIGCNYKNRRSDSDPLGRMDYSMQVRNGTITSFQPPRDDNSMESSNDLKNVPVPSINIPETGSFQLSREVINSAPPSPGGKNFHSYNNVRLNNLLGIPQTAPITSASPRLLRRSLSARAPRDINQGYASPRIRKSRPPSLIVGPEFYADSISAINVPVGNPDHNKNHAESRALSILMSGIYAVFLLMMGVIIFINDQHREHRMYSEVFSSAISGLGILWLLIFHVDLCMYKTEVLKQLKEREDAMQEASERFSTATEFIINSGFDFSSTQNITDGKAYKPPPYRFLMGRHSGSFYLKIGSAVCFEMNTSDKFIKNDREHFAQERDEYHPSRRGAVNTQNCRTRGSASSDVVHKPSLHPDKITVLCDHLILDSFFIEENASFAPQICSNTRARICNLLQ